MKRSTSVEVRYIGYMKVTKKQRAMVCAKNKLLKETLCMENVTP